MAALEWKTVKSWWDQNWEATRDWRVRTEQAIAYFHGDQWNKIQDGRIIAVNRDGPQAKLNKFQKHARTIRAQLLKTRPIGEPKPAGSTNRAIMGARAARSLAYTLAEKGGYWPAIDAGVLWSWFSGTGITKSFWLTRKDQFSAIDDYRCRSVIPFDFACDPTATCLEDADWIIHRSVLSPSKVKTLYGKELKPDSQVEPRYNFSSVTRQRLNLGCQIHEVWVRPCADYPEGAYVAFGAGEPLTDPAAPWPTKDLPFTVWPFEGTGEAVWGETPAWAGIDVQQYVNKAYTNVLDILKKLPSPDFLAAIGQFTGVQSEVTAQAGYQFLQYDGDKNPNPPREISLPQMPQWLWQLLDKLMSIYDDVDGVSAAMQGQAPFSQVTGRALAFLLEQDQTILGPASQNLGRACVRMTKLALAGFKEYGPSSVRLTIPADIGPDEIREFAKAEIDWGDIVYEEGSLLNRSQAVLSETITTLTNQKIIEPAQAQQILRRAGVLEDDDPYVDDVNRARKNIEMCKAGLPPPIEDYYALPVHAEIWMSWAKGDEWDQQSPEVQDMARQYIAELKARSDAQQMPPPQPGMEGAPPPAAPPEEAPGPGSPDASGLAEPPPVVPEPGNRMAEEASLQGRTQ